MKKEFRDGLDLNIGDRHLHLIARPSSDYVDMGPIYKSDLTFGIVLLVERKDRGVDLDLSLFKEIAVHILEEIKGYKKDEGACDYIFTRTYDNISRYLIISVFTTFLSKYKPSWKICFSWLSKYDGDLNHVITINEKDLEEAYKKVLELEEEYLTPDDFKERG